MAIRLTVRPLGGHEPTALTFDQQRVRIGRGAGCDLRLPHRAVSVEHAMVMLEGDRYYVIDLGSTNGTTLRDEVLVIQRRKLLRSGDVLGIAGFEIEFSAGVPMLSAHSHDRTMAAARQLVHQLMTDESQGLSRAALVVANGPQTGQRFELVDPPGTMIIGRATDCDIPLTDGECSRRHVEVDVTAEGILVRDLGSRNALLVNGREVSKQRLRDRDELLVGSTTIMFDDPVDAHLQDLARLPDAETVAAQAGPSSAEPSAADAGPSTPGARAPGDVRPTGASGRPSGSGSAVASGGPKSPPGVSSAGEPEQGAAGARFDGTALDEPDTPVVPAPGPDGARATIARRQPLKARASSAGSEIAILLVGAIALAACVAALIWIFR